jgi:hypothetical protein
LRALEQVGLDDSEPPGASALRERLESVRQEVQAIKQAAAAASEHDPIIERYCAVLSRCRDCREALLALPQAQIDPPGDPRNLRVRLEGNRRGVSWEPPLFGKQPDAYIVQRALTRPGARPAENPYKTIYEGSLLYWNDDEIAHGGSIVRYAVHSVTRGRIEVEGSTIREYEVASKPTSTSVLIWQEVMNLRSVRRPQGLELSWYQPSGARQVRIERWPGSPSDRPTAEAPTLIPTSGEARLLDTSVQANLIFTYRLSCVYDGPEGEFRTPGVYWTDGLPSTSAASPAPAADDAEPLVCDEPVPLPAV